MAKVRYGQEKVSIVPRLSRQRKRKEDKQKKSE